MRRRTPVGLAALALALVSASAAWTQPPTAGDARPVELDAVEAAAERVLLGEALDLIRDKKHVFAVARLAPLTKSRFLPTPVAENIPGLIDNLRSLDAATKLAATPAGKLPAVAAESLSAAVRKPLAWVELLQAVETLLETPFRTGTELPWTAAHANKLLDVVAQEFGGDAAGKLRAELSAKLMLVGKSKDATELLGDETPGEHARQVLADLRTIIVGGGALVNPQVARFVPEIGIQELPGVAPLVPTHLRAKWQRPKPPTETETTLAKLEKQARKELTDAAEREKAQLTAKVTKATEAIRTELSKPAPAPK
jgi:hypothetical protein